MALTQADIAAIWNYKPTGATYTAYQYLKNASSAKDALGAIGTNITAIKKSTDTLAALTRAVGTTATVSQATALKAAVDKLASAVQVAELKTAIDGVSAALARESSDAVPSDEITAIVQDAVGAAFVKVAAGSGA